MTSLAVPRLSINPEHPLSFRHIGCEQFDLWFKAVNDDLARFHDGGNVLMDQGKPSLVPSIKLMRGRESFEQIVDPLNRGPNRGNFSDQPSGENVKVVPRFCNFGRLFNDDMPGRHFFVVGGTERNVVIELSSIKLKPSRGQVHLKINSKLPSQKFAFVFRRILLDLCHRSAISERTTTERNKRCCQRLSFVQIKDDHHCQDDSDRRSNAGPFGSFHSFKLPRPPQIVEGVAP
jgi:hypothetical protein